MRYELYGNCEGKGLYYTLLLYVIYYTEICLERSL